MPTYAYRGTKCGHEFETYRAFTDDPVTQCEECGGPVRQVISGVGVTFKGPGFYRTDSRSGSGKTASVPPSPSEKSKASKSSGASAPTPAAGPAS